ncbi:predicted protein [Uncinocarpus reesii 1704]|uniref:Carboxypeptidase n=1 Tax=Uncinocarpus reesii (strain UAMH 1704) TaxID=336963 RepID=C4JW44_UNCRE|nr:uncharacterized protein UREG_06786 [Uncinocarpus reesii 1704]EEP81921.1 predicted protein [Uncinocarpus reesii 1704]
MPLNSFLPAILAVAGLIEAAPPPKFPGISWRTTFVPIPLNEDGSPVPGWKRAVPLNDTSKYVVKSLPNAPAIPPSWAGRIGVPGVAEGNEQFFWLFETENKKYDDRLIIWLNGGPGCSSMIGAFAENGPLTFVGDTSQLERNPYSWTKLGHVLYIDQPVGTGFSTATYPTPAIDILKITELFYSWLKQFYTVFPHLRHKRTHLIGESYGGIYVPYFAEKILKHNKEFPVNLTSIAIGNGAIGNNIAMSDVTAGAYIKEKAKQLGVAPDIVDAFAKADHICGLDSVREKAAHYPPKGHFGIPTSLNNATGFTGDTSCSVKPNNPKAILSSILDSKCYGRCATYATARDHIETIREKRCYSMYNINYDCKTPNPLSSLTKYLNRADVQSALNIRPSNPGITTPHRFETCNQTILDSLFSPSIQPVPPTQSILPSILTTHRIPVHIFQGELDMVINHVAVELVLQNMTWNGKQGFKARPTLPFGTNVNLDRKGDIKGGWNGSEAGVWTWERGLTYHRFKEAGHAVPRDQSKEMWHYLKNIILTGFYWDGTPDSRGQGTDSG